MKALIWVLLILLVLAFTTVFVRQYMNHSAPDEKDFEGKAAANDIRVYELLSFSLFCLIYHALCRVRLEVFDPLLRLVTSALVTMLTFTLSSWWAMTAIFHSFRPDKALPFECFLTAFIWSLPSVIVVILLGCFLNWIRVRTIAL